MTSFQYAAANRYRALRSGRVLRTPSPRALARSIVIARVGLNPQRVCALDSVTGPMKCGVEGIHFIPLRALQLGALIQRNGNDGFAHKLRRPLIDQFFKLFGGPQ